MQIFLELKAKITLIQNLSYKSQGMFIRNLVASNRSNNLKESVWGTNLIALIMSQLACLLN